MWLMCFVSQSITRPVNTRLS